MAKLHFLGANRQVTGSRYVLETTAGRVMIDCGMFQERAFESRNWHQCPVGYESIDATVLTHVHIDHCGLLPRAVRSGFDGPIYATRSSCKLADIMLRDAAKIQMEDAKYKKKRHEKEGRHGNYPEEALYDDTDVDRTLPMFHGIDYNTPQQVLPDVEVRFANAGHILGSAIVDVRIKEGSKEKRLLMSGDIGQWNKPIIHDPVEFQSADYVVTESTYGNRNHPEQGDVVSALREKVAPVLKRGGKVVIPVFAVERAQELMYYFSQLVYDDSIPDVPIYVDSPMAVDVTKVFRESDEDFDDETKALIAAEEPPLRFPGLKLTRTAEESRKINKRTGPAIIMSTSGMCTAGRIKHHLRHTLGDAKNMVLFVGYQGKHTLGRQLVEHRNPVRVHGKSIWVRAQIASISGLSGHADRSGLLRWLGSLNRAPENIFLTHGEYAAASSLAKEIRSVWHWPVQIPYYMDTVEI
jgi:metallo-beta-lactamase family protein